MAAIISGPAGLGKDLEESRTGFSLSGLARSSPKHKNQKRDLLKAK
jgi:hypothetical protein